MKAPRFFWRVIQMGPHVLYRLGFGSLIGKMILLLTTRGRKSGRMRTTPLVYEQYGEMILVASARGPSADWLQNIRANPNVQVRIGRRMFEASAEITTEPASIADYLQRQLERNPGMFSAILRLEGLSSPPSRDELLRFAPKRPMVILHPKHALS